MRGEGEKPQLNGSAVPGGSERPFNFPEDLCGLKTPTDAPSARLRGLLHGTRHIQSVL